jgi:hypothetical protein
MKSFVQITFWLPQDPLAAFDISFKINTLNITMPSSIMNEIVKASAGARFFRAQEELHFHS